MSPLSTYWNRFRQGALKRGHELSEKGLDHWLSVAILTILGLIMGRWIGDADIWQDLRYRIYQFQTSRLHIGQPAESRIVHVLIEDDEYWKGEPARRVPIKRDYIARLLRAVDKANPGLIALDFDLRSPVPSGEMIEHPDYECERQELLHAIFEVAHNRPIILPKQIDLVENDYREQSDIFRGFDFSAVKENIFPGYIQLAYDLRVIPPRLEVLGEPDGLDSFALAIVHADDPDMYSQIIGKQSEGDELNLKFGKFLDTKHFEKLSVSAADVLAGKPEVLKRLGFKLVIVGGKWHEDAFGIGELNDEHLTPAGRIIGAYVHGNYAEALRKGDWSPAWSETWAIVLELLMVLGASVAFATELAWGWKMGAAVVPSLLTIVVSYFFLQNLGLFFDFFVPLVVIVAHTLIEHLQWRTN